MDSAPIDRILASPLTPHLMHAYFDPSGPFAGVTFDEVGENPPNEFTTGDLLAVSLLDVRLRPPAVRALLAGDLDGSLAAIDSECDLWSASDEALANAGALWSELVSRDPRFRGAGPTIASKLLSRKRPSLVPIADSVILGLLLPTAGRFWVELRETLTDGRREALRGLVPAGCEATELRVLDVALWITHSRSRNAVAARRQAATA